jgi:hypothetical protein
VSDVLALLNHYDHAESVATGHRVFWRRRLGEEIQLDIHEFARWAGVSTQALEQHLQEKGLVIPLKRRSAETESQ